jgi:phage-related protein
MRKVRWQGRKYQAYQAYQEYRKPRQRQRP